MFKQFLAGNIFSNFYHLLGIVLAINRFLLQQKVMTQTKVIQL
jgi:hypothetical protein